MKANKLMKFVVALGVVAGAAITAGAPTALANSKAPATAPKNIRMKIIDGAREDGLRLCWDAVPGAASYEVYVNASLMASTGNTNCFQFNPELSRYQSRDGKLSQFQIRAVNRAGGGPVSKASDIRLEYDPKFNMWQVPSEPLYKRCAGEAGFFVVSAIGAGLSVLAAPPTGGLSLIAGGLSLIGGSGGLVMCII
jgi:hypothetical protein